MANSRKTYLYGLGTGLIAGAVLLQLASIGQSSSAVPSEMTDPVTVEALREAADANGYVLHDKKETWFTESQVKSETSKAEERIRKELEGKEGGKVYAFTIGTGTELTTVARMLYELGFIDDYNGFLIEMDEQGLSGKIQAKHYRFDSIPPQDELIQALTSP